MKIENKYSLNLINNNKVSILFKKKENKSAYKKYIDLNNCPKANENKNRINKKDDIKDTIKKLFDNNKIKEQIKLNSPLNKRKNKQNIFINNCEIEDKIINNIKEKRNISKDNKKSFNNYILRKHYSAPKVKKNSHISKTHYNYNNNEIVQYDNENKRKQFLMDKIIENQKISIYKEFEQMKIIGKNRNNINNKKLRKLNSLGYNFFDIDDISINGEETHYKLNNRLKSNIMNYKISKIIYTLNSHNIQSIEINYKNRSNGIIEIYDINNHLSSSNSKKFEINFPDTDEIKLLDIYNKNSKNIGFKIICNQKNYIIGRKPPEKRIYKNEFEIKKFKNQILLGIEVKANPKIGISSLDFKYTDNKNLGIYLSSGLLQLRSKLKKNPHFKKEFLKKKNLMDEKHKLIATICDLPDTMFFPIISYLILI